MMISVVSRARSAAFVKRALLVEAFARLEQETFEEILGTRVWWRLDRPSATRWLNGSA